ncbi:MAG: cytochrome c [Lysobacteraceae bacterium]
MSVAPRRGWWVLILGFPLLALLLAVGGVLIGAQGGFEALRVPKGAESQPLATDAATVARGKYLATLGNCVTCHSTRSSEPLAGGRAFPAEFGVLYSSNITPDMETGIGRWTTAQFRHAMKHGVGPNGLLYPAFPFQNFQHLETADVDAIFAWLKQQPAVASTPPSNTLSAPASWRGALLAWRMLFHRPQPLREVPGQGEAWNRGRYLVEGLGHCDMCHGERAAYGSLSRETHLSGSRIPGQGWYAPALNSQALARWDIDSLATYLRTGTASHGGAYGPMAEVIYSSLQHLSSGDAEAIATYITSLPPPRIVPSQRDALRLGPVVRARSLAGGPVTALYQRHCADCHGDDGRGRDGIYPPLAGNPGVMAADPVNLIRVTLFGAAAPVTAGNPAPHTMPPFIDQLGEDDLVALLNHVRGSWGNDASAITHSQLRAVRSLPLD